MRLFLREFFQMENEGDFILVIIFDGDFTEKVLYLGKDTSNCGVEYLVELVKIFLNDG